MRCFESSLVEERHDETSEATVIVAANVKFIRQSCNLGQWVKGTVWVIWATGNEADRIRIDLCFHGFEVAAEIFGDRDFPDLNLEEEGCFVKCSMGSIRHHNVRFLDSLSQPELSVGNHCEEDGLGTS